MAVSIRFGTAADIDAAVSIFERSNLARRRGDWPDRVERVEKVRARLRDPASWFLVAHDGPAAVAMAAAEPSRAHDGLGPIVPGACFVNLLFVVPERWGQGIGGAILDAVLAEARRRRSSRISLWTPEDDERTRRLYSGRGFAPTGRHQHGQAEWARSL